GGLELRTTLGREVPGRLAGGDRLEHFAHLGDRGQVGEVDGAGERSAPGEGDDQVVALESLERFADGGPPDFELLAQGRLVDGVTGGDVEHDESVAKDLVGAIGQGRLPCAHIGRTTHADPRGEFAANA